MSTDTNTNPEREAAAGVVPFSVIEQSIVSAETPMELRSIDDKLAVMQELFRRERRALTDQNLLATYRIRAQRRGGQILQQVVRQGRPTKRSQGATFSLPDGIDKSTSARWQELARIAEKTFDDYLGYAGRNSIELTTAGFLRFAEGKKDDVHFSSDSPEWYTPKGIVTPVLDVLGTIDLDPCSNSKTNPNVPATRVFTKDDDGLARDWEGRVYMNPPYGRELVDWIHKLCSEHESGDVPEAIALVPSRTDTAWFRRMRPYPRCFLFGRLSFSGHENSAPFPSMLVYLGPEKGKFVQAFREEGDVFEVVKD